MRTPTIMFAIEDSPDVRFRKWIWVPVKKGEWVAKVAADRGHPEDAEAIAEENGIRSVMSKFSGRGRTRIKVPGNHAESASFRVMPGDTAPRVVRGYPKLSVLDRPGRSGLSVFEGYDPIQVIVPIRFEAVRSNEGVQVEADIALLEKMAGRGQFAGAAIGPPATVHVTTYAADGRIAPLLPYNYQRYAANKTGPLYRIANIDWDEDALRNAAGNRIRQLAEVTLEHDTAAKAAPRSATERSRSRSPSRDAQRRARDDARARAQYEAALAESRSRAR